MILRASQGKVRAFIVGDPNQAIYGSLGGYAITAHAFGTMAGIALKEMELSHNYRSSDRIIGYFGNYNVHTAKISSAAKHKDYARLISSDTVTKRDDLEGDRPSHSI